MNRRNFIIKSNTYVLSWLLGLPPLARAQAPAALRPYTAASLAEIRQAHAGKPFVLSFWALHCEPCREEMAVWRAVTQKHPALAVELVSTDALKDAAVIAAFFAKYPPGAVRKWVFADAFTERVRYLVDKSWRGELPKTYFFDATHKPLVKSGKVDLTWIDAWFTASSRDKR